MNKHGQVINTLIAMKRECALLGKKASEPLVASEYYAIVNLTDNAAHADHLSYTRLRAYAEGQSEDAVFLVDKADDAAAYLQLDRASMYLERARICRASAKLFNWLADLLEQYSNGL
jgi:hypothetical protein